MALQDDQLYEWPPSHWGLSDIPEYPLGPSNPTMNPQPQKVETTDYPVFTGIQPVPPPPPPPPPKDEKKKIAGGPVTSPEEVKADAKLSPEEESQIEIDQPPSNEIAMPEQYVGQGPNPDLENPNAPFLGFPHAPGQPVAPPAVAAAGAPNDTALEQPGGVPAGLADVQHALFPELLHPPQFEHEQPAGTTRDYQQEKVDYYTQHPDQLIEDQARSAAEAKQQASTRLLDELKKKQAQDAADYQAHQDAMATGQQMAEQIANTKIDPDQWWHSRSTGQRIAAFIGLALGGLQSTRMGGRNVALEQINRYIDSDIDAQKANLANRRSALSDFYRQTGDLYTAQQAYRAGVWNNVVSQLQAEEQNYDPQGTIARSIAMQKLQAQAEAKKAADAAAQKTYENTIKGYETSAKVGEAQANIAKLNAETQGILAKQAGMGAGGAGVSVKAYGTTYPSYNEVPEKLRKLAFTLPNGGVMITNNEKNAEQAQALSEAYAGISRDLDEMTKLAIERHNAKSGPGNFRDKWKDSQERHFEQLAVDVANTYGVTIHGGRPLPAGTLEEVMKAVPQLKGLIDRGDTTEELNRFRDDIDARMSGKLSVLAGSKVQVTSAHPQPVTTDVKTLAAPLLSKPVKGEAGYGRLSQDVGQTVKALQQEYLDHPENGGQAAYVAHVNQLALAQNKAIVEIQDEIAKLEKIKKPTTQQALQLSNARLALIDRERARDAIDAARGADVGNDPNQPSRLERYTDALEGAADFLSPGAASSRNAVKKASGE